jgi:urease accessory protein
MPIRSTRIITSTIIITTMATITNTGIAMARDRTSTDVTPLLVWLSPSFPVGSFAYSHGLEWAVEAGDVRDAASLERWLDDLLRHGGPWSDAVLLAHAHRAVTASDDNKLAEAAALAAALAPSRERKLETLAQGSAFLAAVRAAWPSPVLDRATPFENEIAFPVAVGIAAAGRGLALAPTLEAYLVALATNLVSAAVRLIPLGQTDGTKTVAKLAPLAKQIAALAAAASIDDIGGAALRSDIASMRHETQYTRLFRS